MRARDVLTGRTSAVLAGALAALLAVAGCKDDVCKDMDPAFEVTVKIDAGVDVDRIKKLRVTVRSGTQEQKKNYDITGELSDRQTSFWVNMGAETRESFTVNVTVLALDKDDK